MVDYGLSRLYAVSDSNLPLYLENKMEEISRLENLSLQDDPEQVKMCVWLFQCVTDRKFDPIRLMISRLPLPERRTIIFSKSLNTSLLAHAYNEKAVKIVEYFITECDANVHEYCLLDGKWLPPLYLAVKTGCLPMVLMLLKNGAEDVWFDDENRNAIVYACQARNSTLAYVLKMYGSNINCDQNIRLCARDKAYYSRALPLGTDVNHCTTSGNNLFIEAVVYGNYDLVKSLQSKNIDIYYRNKDCANALDLMVWKENMKMVSFLIKENIYSVADLIFSYDFCGARKVFENEFMEGIRFWLMATKLRKPQDPNVYNTFSCDELSNLELEYDEEAAITTEKYRRALEIYLFLHSPQNVITKKAFCHIAMSGHYNDKNSFIFLRQLFCFYMPEELPEESTVSYSVRTAIEYAEQALGSIRDLPECSVSVFEQFIEFIRKYMYPFLNEHLQQIPHYFSLYKYMLYVVLKYIDYFINTECDPEDNQLIELLIGLIAHIYLTHYPTSLLLLAISKGFSLKVITFLVESKSDLHVVDENLNTPLHLAGQRPNNLPDTDKISMLLISAGSNIDAKNIIGYTPVDYLKTLISFEHF